MCQSTLRTVVYHTALNHLARQSRLVSLDSFEPNELDELLKRQERRLDQPEAALILAENVRELHALVDALPPKFAAAIRLRFFQGLSYKSMAERLNCPVNTAKSDVRRGLLLLRKAIETRRIKVKAKEAGQLTSAIA